MGFFTAAKGKIFPHIPGFCYLFFFFNQMWVKLQKQGKFLKYCVFNAAWSAPQKCRIWNNGRVTARIFFPLACLMDLLLLCFFLYSPDVDAVQFTVIFLVEGGQIYWFTYRIFIFKIEHTDSLQDVLMCLTGFLTPKQWLSLCNTKQIWFIVVKLPWGSYVCCLFLKTILLKGTRLKHFCLSHPFSNKTSELLR